MRLRPLAAVGALLVAAGLLVAPTATATTATTQETGLAQVDRAILQKIADEAVRGAPPGVIVRVDDRRQGTIRVRSGLADLDTGRPVTPNSHYRVGSITKTFTAVVVLQLVHEGHLSLDDKVDKILPGMVRGSDKIAVRHLLNHTNGLYTIPDTELAKRMLSDPKQPTTAADLVAYGNRKGAAPSPDGSWGFEPGTKQVYNNLAFNVLGLIAEKVTGQSLTSLYQQRILRPLHLHGTSLPSTHQLPRPHARGYTEWKQWDVPFGDFTDWHPSWGGAAGGIVSTTKDLNRFYRALVQGRLLPPQLLKEMRTPFSGPSHLGKYGFALAIEDLSCGVTVNGHGGGVPGFESLSLTSQDGSRQISVSVNYLGDGPRSPAVVTAFHNLRQKTFCG
ncbi:serine hydrolase [Longimycelium tulufanense]|uniref:Serine hydrolase n=1 Tax=Longimycelium tulufanense TaxID=907463 RepID=A0A8J3C6J3_9PSEU|nr:serine hydrolase domain-containing protein [Longimycelium tulufanense]GGM40958.1 serine hydrolase [Longimycelium tulufanense]